MLNDISPINGVDPLISPVLEEICLKVARVEILAPLLAKTIAKCFSNHSERNDDDDIFNELGSGSNCNSLRILTDEKIPQELVGIPISAEGCNNKMESLVVV